MLARDQKPMLAELVARGGRYEGGARAMLKVKHERTADCVVTGARTRRRRATLPRCCSASMTRTARWSTSASRARSRADRERMAVELALLAVPIESHPWERGFLLGGGAMGRLKGAAGRWEPGMTMDWVPLAPQRACEVTYTQVDGHRLRHPARFVRWRPDREPRSCRLDQLDEPLVVPAEVLDG